MSEKQLMRRLRKITAVVVVISILLFLGGGFITSSLGRVQKDTMTTQMISEAEEYKANVLRKIKMDQQTLQTLASFFRFSNTISMIDTDAFANGLYESNRHNSFIQMGYFTEDGDGIRVTVDREIKKNVRVEDLEEELQASIGEAWQGESAVSRVYEDARTGEKVFSYAVPVYQGDEITGVLTAKDSIEAFEDILDDKTAMNGYGYVHMIGKEGKFLIRSKNKVVNRRVESIFDGNYITEAEKEKIREAIDNDESVFSKFRYQGTAYQIYLNPIGLNGWYLFCVDTMQGVNAPIYQMINVTRAIFIGVLCLSVFLLIYGYQMLRKNHKQLIELAYYDSLTGAYNTVRFMQEMKDALSGPEKYSVCVLNIHQFKFINEIFGRAQGDKLLCHISQVLKESVNPGEYFCRDTGDFFWMILKGQNEEAIRERLYEMMEKISRFSLSQHHNYQIMIYCGVAVRRDDSSAEMMMTHAMFALQTAKGTDRNNVWFYDVELHKQETLQNYIESHMHQALKDKEFRMFLQPKMDMRTGKLGGAEALVRWIPKDGTIIYPNQFIPLFESNGFCSSLDMYMVENVCRKIREWIDAGITPVPISVNQSKILFYEEDYVENLCAVLERYRIPGDLITLEILEGLAAGNIDELNEKIDQLKEKGFRISMDDFGSGYSSFNTLGKLHIDELKMDRVFLSAITGKEDERQKIIMAQVVDLAKKLRISTVAEGVETKENETLIRTLGCGYGQGYYYSRPIDEDEFDRKYMEKGNGNHEV
ncbi:EAL domain-containing protein [Drancourtella massiliensis]|mgnify:FL=1|uniref:EAL domain-containing protein n=1 Tax=Drancourtella massiliensis TaxID=1632013 RepID=A0ABS2EKN3_9FIRM|nr:EAL domain-containing protein [Drancourtella massiliensis]MBM6745504.1 EAL domain-containing protein [Drancourtella massiliensis]